MRFQTTTRPLRDLVRDFHAGAILLPQFQRDYVWKAAKVRNLLDSLLKGFPIGGFYLWRPASGMLDAKAKTHGEQRFAPQFEGYLIDGQQRLTSLEASYGLYTGEDTQGAELRCYLDLSAPDIEEVRDTRLFVSYAGKKSIARRVEAGDSTLIPVSLLFDGQNYELRKITEEALRLLSNWNSKRVEDALERLDRSFGMLDQQVPCTTVIDVSDKEAVEVFSRLNKGGSALRQGDVRAAELARGRAVDVLKRMRDFVSGERPQRLGFGFSFAFRALVLFHRGSAQFSTLKHNWMEAPGPNGQSLDLSWRDAERAIEKALEFVDTSMGWSRRTLVPSANAVIILAAAFDKSEGRLNADDKQAYRRWLCLTSLRGVFQGSVESTINRFQRAIRNKRTELPKALLEALRRDEARKIRSEELNRYAQLWGPATQVIHAWLVNQKAKDWLSTEPIDDIARGGTPSLPVGDLTVHHIFPRKLLSEVVDNPDKANCPANFALLSRPTNSEFGAKPPDEVLAMLTPDQRKTAGIQFFGEAAGDRLKLDRYSEFCEWRAGRLADSINDWLGLV